MYFHLGTFVFIITMFIIVCANKTIKRYVKSHYHKLTLHDRFFVTDRRLNLSDPLKFRSMSGTELTVLVANHLLGKLATSSCYLVDKNCNGKKGDQCFCGEDSCTMTGTYGDTSIGEVNYIYHF